jgi:hypothetical protein
MSARKLQASVVGGLLLLGLAVWLRTHEEARAPSATPAAGGAELALQPAPAITQKTAPPAAAAAGAAGQRASGAASLTPERQQLRERVMSTLREREGKRAVAARAPAGAAAASDQLGTMVDKTGEMTAEEMRILNHELMPMVSQCLEQAHERDPQLKGMLALEVRFAGAEDLGSIIESVEPAAINDLGEQELIECVRQSAFSLQFPVPSSDRRGERQLTIPFGIDPEAWRPREGVAQPSSPQPSSR